MATPGSIEIHTAADGSFLVWRERGRIHCEAKYPDGTTKRFRFWNEIPAPAIPAIEKAVDELTPPRLFYPKDPWSNPGFRVPDLNSCTNCPQFAS